MRVGVEEAASAYCCELTTTYFILWSRVANVKRKTECKTFSLLAKLPYIIITFIHKYKYLNFSSISISSLNLNLSVKYLTWHNERTSYTRTNRIAAWARPSLRYGERRRANKDKTTSKTINK